MDSDRLNRWLTLGANIGVLIGLALLLFELSQNREATRADTRSNISHEISSLLSQVAFDEEVSDIRLRGDRGDQLTELELYRYELLQRSLFRYWENVHYQYRIGLYDESEFDAHKQVWNRYVGGSRGLFAYWCSVRHLMSADFADEMNSSIEGRSCNDIEDKTTQ